MYFDETIGSRIEENNWEHEIAMAGDENWIDIGSTDEPFGPPLRRIKAVIRELAISTRPVCGGRARSGRRAAAMHQGERAMAANNSQSSGNK
ncbi:MAG: hypothetical protein ACREC0_14205 [Methylocella sp.]